MNDWVQFYASLDTWCIISETSISQQLTALVPKSRQQTDSTQKLIQNIHLQSEQNTHEMHT